MTLGRDVPHWLSAAALPLLLVLAATACGPPQDDDGEVVVLTDTGTNGQTDADRRDGGHADGGRTDGGRSDGGQIPPGSCEFAADGVCDEPANCALGTDERDCVTACRENKERMHLFGAACEYRDMAESPARRGYEQPTSTGGSEHLTGWRDSHIPIPNGYDTDQNVDRHFRVYVPRSYDPDQAYPLMINMAGHRVSHWVLPGYTSLHRTAEANDFIVIFAGQQFRFGQNSNGKYLGWWAWWSEWGGSSLGNAGPCRQQTPESNPDYEYIRKLVDWAGQEYNIDRRRVYLSGHSRGAAMAFMAAIQMPDLIAGAGVQSGFTECGWLDEQMPADGGWDGRKVPFFFFHGTADADVCINCAGGGQSCAANFQRKCARGMHATDGLVDRLEKLGWKPWDHYNYFRLSNVAHRWQPQLNQQMWDYLSERPLPAEDGSSD